RCETFSRCENVALDLLSQGIHRTELLLIAQFLYEREFQLLFVDVTNKIEEVRLHPKVARRAFERGAVTDVQDGAMHLLADVRMDGPNPMRRQSQSGDINVCGREPELASDAIAAHHFSVQGIFAAEHLFGVIELAGPDHFADPGAADDLAVQRNCRQSVDMEVQFVPQAFEQFHVASSLMAKSERSAHANTVNLATIARQLADKCFTRQLAECLVKVNQQRRIGA